MKCQNHRTFARRPLLLESRHTPGDFQRQLIAISTCKNEKKYSPFIEPVQWNTSAGVTVGLSGKAFQQFPTVDMTIVGALVSAMSLR